MKTWGRAERHPLAATFGQQRHSPLVGVGGDPVSWGIMQIRRGYPVIPADVNTGSSLHAGSSTSAQSWQSVEVEAAYHRQRLAPCMHWYLTVGGHETDARSIPLCSKVKKRVARQFRVKTRGPNATDRQSIRTDSKRSTRSRLAVVLNT